MVCYDISEDRRRYRVEKELSKWGDRVQWSLFECFLSVVEARQLMAALAPLIDEESDTVRAYPLCRWCQEQMSWLGEGERQLNYEMWVV